MPAAKTIEKQINNLTDTVLVDKLCEILRGLGPGGIDRVLSLYRILIDGHKGLIMSENLNWNRISEEDAIYIQPIILELNNIVTAFKNIPAERKDNIVETAKGKV